MYHIESKGTGVVFVVLENGDGLLESLQTAAKEAGIHTGILLSGIGSLQKARIHIVSSNDLPPTNEFIDLPGPLEVSNFTGIIAAYEPHVHITFMDSRRHMVGGHLEEGCEILTLAEFSILRIPDIRLARRQLAGKLFSLLVEE